MPLEAREIKIYVIHPNSTYNTYQKYHAPLWCVAIFGLGAKLMTFSLKAKANKSPLRGAGDLHEKRETAQYISEMTLVLRNLAKTHEMLSLQGLLEVAHYEAFIVATQNELPENELEHLKELSRASIG